MTVTQRLSAERGIVTPASVRRWSWARALAVAGLPILVWEAWTVVAWLADGPYQITEYRDRGSVSWYAARALEGLVLLGSAAVIVYLIRGCRREGRFLTFDVMFCMAGATLFWADLGPNLIAPVWLPSSNFTNLNNTCGHMPFVVNPDCGRIPDPILFNWFLCTFCLLGLAVLFGKLVARWRARWPGMRNVKVVGLLILVGIGIDVILEPGFTLPLKLWAYALPSWMSIPGFSHGFWFPIIEMIVGGTWFGLMLAIRIMKDDRGLTIVERGLERHTPRQRKFITLAALYGLFQITLWGLTLPMIPLAFYQDPWPKLPAHIVNGACDAPGFSGTRYGPCTGSPGFRLPGRNSLPGRSP